VLTEEQIRDIERGRQQGLSGPVVGTWVDRLLAERRELLAQITYIRERLRQAATYLDGLFDRQRAARESSGREKTPRSGTQR
jgi:hypothetical protein